MNAAQLSLPLPTAAVIEFTPRISKHHGTWRWISSHAVAAYFHRRHGYIERDIGRLLQRFPTCDHVCFRRNGDVSAITAHGIYLLASSLNRGHASGSESRQRLTEFGVRYVIAISETLESGAASYQAALAYQRLDLLMVQIGASGSV
jgi:hypothetical protein